MILPKPPTRLFVAGALLAAVSWAAVLPAKSANAQSAPMALAAHRAVLKAVSEGNAKRAESVLRQHLELSYEYCDRKFGSMLDQPVRWH